MEYFLPPHDALRLARRHANANSSAWLCLTDAERAYAAWDFEVTRAAAIRSLRHSVGVFHRDFKRATRRTQ
jgi:hypothetical protein